MREAYKLTRTAPTRRCENVAKVVSRSLSVLALTTMSCTLRPAACKSAMTGVLGKGRLWSAAAQDRVRGRNWHRAADLLHDGRVCPDGGARRGRGQPRSQGPSAHAPPR